LQAPLPLLKATFIEALLVSLSSTAKTGAASAREPFRALVDHELQTDRALSLIAPLCSHLAA